MSEAFDPYHKWLAIPPEQQPPNHYRLLGTKLFEDDLDVIEAAADRQMAHLRTYQSSRHVEECQRLLNEVAAARVCLLNPDKKAEYDAELRRKIQPPAAMPIAEPLEDKPVDQAMEGLFKETERAPSLVQTHLVKEKRQSPAAIIAGVLAFGVAVPLVLLLLTRSRPDRTTRVHPAAPLSQRQEQSPTERTDTQPIETPGLSPPEPAGNMLFAPPPVEDVPTMEPTPAEPKKASALATVPWRLPPDAPPPAIAPFDTDQAKQHQQAWADYLGVPIEREINVGEDMTMTFVLIPPGEFLMGDPNTTNVSPEPDPDNPLEFFRHNGPAHPVRITKPFYLTECEVTVGQFRQFVKTSGYQTEAETSGGVWLLDTATRKRRRHKDAYWDEPGFDQTEQHPVACLTWNDAQAFCRWLSKQEGTTCRLPTEAEWEHACRAGTTTTYSFGHDAKLLPEYASPLRTPVGQKRANPWGLRDIHGSISEWCLDWNTGPYASSSEIDPQGPPTGDRRVIRGRGASASRYSERPHWRAEYTGLRVLCELVDAKQSQE